MYGMRIAISRAAIRFAPRRLSSHASPTLYDQRLYKTARSGKSFSYTVSSAAGTLLCPSEVRRALVEGDGQRPMNIEVNGLVVRENWDPGSAAGQLGMAVGSSRE